jgi:hypothetical protein
MRPTLDPFRFLLITVAGWLGQQQRDAIDHLREENRVLRVQLGGKRLRTIKESCLDRMILFGEGSLPKVIREFVAHYHGERNHQGLGNRLIIPDESHAGNAGAIRRRERLGGMLNYYYRAAA